MSDLVDWNPSLKGCITSLRILYSNATKNLHLVLLCVDSSKLKSSILANGRIFFAFRAHRVVDVDADKEVRRCQRYGHSKQFCKAISSLCGIRNILSDEAWCSKIGSFLWEFFHWSERRQYSFLFNVLSPALTWPWGLFHSFPGSKSQLSATNGTMPGCKRPKTYLE